MLKKILNQTDAKPLKKEDQKLIVGGRKKGSPCGTTGFDVLEHITSPEGCIQYGAIWWNNRCIICR